MSRRLCRKWNQLDSRQTRRPKSSRQCVTL